MKRIIVPLLALTLLGQSGAARAQPASQESGVKEVSYGVGSALGSLVYTPLKGLLCVMGGAASGLLFLTDGAEARDAVAGAACKGTWLITPGVLKGEEPLDVVGEIPSP